MKNTMQEQLQKLLKVPRIVQKSEEWYKARENMISASDFAQALGKGKFGTQNQLIQKKCEPVNESAFSLTNPFFKWGNMFESVACDIYSSMNDVFIYEFGLIKHPVHEFFGASPDGISNLGIMLEIKCPLKRKIGGEVPTQYYYQIQGQLDVCGLEECDYFECEFVQEYNESTFKKEINHFEFSGVIFEDIDVKFTYSPLFKKGGDYKKIIQEFLDSRDKNHIKTILWHLKKSHTVRVKRDDAFLKENFIELEKVWNKIIYYRKNKDKYIIEILNKVDIMDTETLYEKEVIKKLAGYSIQDCPD